MWLVGVVVKKVVVRTTLRMGEVTELQMKIYPFYAEEKNWYLNVNW